MGNMATKAAKLLGLYADLRAANRRAGEAIRTERPAHALATDAMARFLVENRKVSALILQIKAIESA